MISKNLFAIADTNRKGQKRKWTSPRCSIIKREGATHTSGEMWFSEGRCPALIPALGVPLTAEFSPSTGTVETAKSKACESTTHDLARDTLPPAPGRLRPGSEGGVAPRLRPPRPEAQLTPACAGPRGCQRPARCCVPGTARPHDGRRGLLWGGGRRRRLGAAPRRPGTPPCRGPGPGWSAASPLGIGRARTRASPWSSSLSVPAEPLCGLRWVPRAHSPDLWPPCRRYSPIPLPPWTCLGGGQTPRHYPQPSRGAPASRGPRPYSE